MFKQIISVVVLLSLVSGAYSELASAQDIFNNVAVLDVGHDTIRAYAYSSILGFSLAGVSVYGNIAQDGSSAKLGFDSNIFSFNGVNAGYTVTYAQASIGSGAGSANVSAGFYAAVYQPFLLVEYEETNKEDGFQLGGDTVLGWTRVDSLATPTNQWDIDMESQDYTVQDPAGNNHTFQVYIVSATSPGGLVNLRFTVSGAPAAVADIKLTAEQTKIDITINGYYDANINPQTAQIVGLGKCQVTDALFSCTSTGASANTNSRLALASWYGTADATADLSASGIVGDTGVVQGTLTWADTVEVGSSSVDVISNVTAFANVGNFGAASSLAAGANGGLLVQSFDAIRPNKIVWDPVVGVERSGNSAAALLPSITLLVTIVFALLL
eukprot:gene9833-11486_t